MLYKKACKISVQRKSKRIFHMGNLKYFPQEESLDASLATLQQLCPENTVCENLVVQIWSSPSSDKRIRTWGFLVFKWHFAMGGDWNPLPNGLWQFFGKYEPLLRHLICSQNGCFKEFAHFRQKKTCHKASVCLRGVGVERLFGHIPLEYAICLLILGLP